MKSRHGFAAILGVFAMLSMTAQVFAQDGAPCTSVAIGAPPDAACAQPAAPATPTVPVYAASGEAPTRRVWYGWQTLTTDGAALVLAGAISGTESDGAAAGLGLASLAAYTLGGPVVHAAHGSPGKMGISLALRVGAPLVLGGAGYVAFGGGTSSKNDWGAALGGALGVFFGVAGAVAIDAAVLARKTVPDALTTARAHISPSVTPVRGGATVGAIGSF